MSEQIKMTENEIKDIKVIQDAFQNKIYQLGQLYLQKLQAESAIKFVQEQEIKLKENWADIQKQETVLIDQLLKKYGQGSLDLKEGIFVPDKQ